jgi:hypothetical protein
MATTNKKYEAAQEFMKKWHAETGKLPVVVGIELYEYFGQWVKIIEARDNGYVIIEARFAERKEVEFDELEMKS